MKIESVNNSQKPNYPTIELFVKHPELLSKNIPNSWLKNQFVVTSFAAFLLSGGCGTSTAKKNVAVEVVDSLDINKKTSTPQKKEVNNDIVTNIAPIFAYGEGRGAIGCLVMSPPVFISEDEAKKIIFDALRKQGILFNTTDCPEIKFTAPPIANDCYEERLLDNDTTKVSDANVELKMDGYNKDLNFAIQFVSREDFSKFTSDNNCWSSVQEYSTKKAAEIIREKLIADGTTNAVVFYDPIVQADLRKNEDWKKSEKEAKAEAKKLLLNQVEDFIKWLREEKIIEK
jgi:hypothetical protein